jgi:hypothetical protein
MSEETKTAIIDRFSEKLISRKLLAWLTATGLLAFADLSSSDWVLVTMTYIGSQAAVDIVARLKGLT